MVRPYSEISVTALFQCQSINKVVLQSLNSVTPEREESKVMHEMIRIRILQGPGRFARLGERMLSMHFV